MLDLKAAISVQLLERLLYHFSLSDDEQMQEICDAIKSLETSSHAFFFSALGIFFRLYLFREGQLRASSLFQWHPDYNSQRKNNSTQYTYKLLYTTNT